MCFADQAVSTSGSLKDSTQLHGEKKFEDQPNTFEIWPRQVIVLVERSSKGRFSQVSQYPFHSFWKCPDCRKLQETTTVAMLFWDACLLQEGAKPARVPTVVTVPVTVTGKMYLA